MKKCYDCTHVEMCGWRKEVEEQGCEFFGDGIWWISVDDRLPEKRQVVLAIGKDSKIWDVGMFQGLSPSGNKHLWWWKKKTVKRVDYWMPKDAVPLPWKECSDE